GLARAAASADSRRCRAPPWRSMQARDRRPRLRLNAWSRVHLSFHASEKRHRRGVEHLVAERAGLLVLQELLLAELLLVVLDGLRQLLAEAEIAGRAQTEVFHAVGQGASLRACKCGLQNSNTPAKVNAPCQPAPQTKPST